MAATTTHRGHTFVNNTKAYELFVKKDTVAFDEHMKQVVKDAKELPGKYAHLEKPPAVGNSRWIPGLGRVVYPEQTYLRKDAAHG